MGLKEKINLDTKEKIIEKYIELVLKTKDANISVTEICEKAEVSRKSFYRYFQDRYSLVETIFIREIEGPMRAEINMGMGYEEITTAIYRNFLSKKDFFMIAMKEEGKNTLFDDIISRIQKLNMEIFNIGLENSTTIEYLSYKYAATQAMLLKKWMVDGMKESPEFMTKVYWKDLDDFIYDFIKFKKL